jgi:5-oxoprolinase (ATP-hydrolysing)
MAQAIAQVSVARGVDPRGCALVGFGGAAGQHVCAIARELGIRTILLHPLAGVLSAHGIANAPLSWDGQRDAGRVALEPELPGPVSEHFKELERAARAALADEGAAPEAIRIERLLDLRYAGTETPLAVREPTHPGESSNGDWRAAFADEHAARFGYTRPGRNIEIVAARVRGVAAQADSVASAGPAAPTREPALPLRHEHVWFPGVGRVEVPVYAREELAPDQRIAGPALVLEDTGTIVLDPGFEAELKHEGLLVVHDRGGAQVRAETDLRSADPIRLEVFGNRFMSIAEQMGAVLRNTSVSTNIKERLDYSCAVFDGSGGLVANAPHIPVHLGAMAETVRVVRERFPDLEDGDVVLTNDPLAGGSHLPDVTVVTPAFLDGERRPPFFVASRGHHADLGGITPGSMPADSTRLEEEGVVFEPGLLVRRGRFDELRVRAALTGARYPARNPDDNVADLEAMVAANRAGVTLLRDLVREHGLAVVDTSMRQLQEAAAGKVAREIARLPDGVRCFEDRMDDGTPVCARLTIDGDRMTIDFAGTGAAQPGNLNAPRAVVQAAVIYVLRALVAERRRLPASGGDRRPVRIAPGSPAGGRRGGGQRRDVPAHRGCVARRPRDGGRQPGHDEQRGLRRRDLRLLRDDWRWRGCRRGLRRRLGRPHPHDEHAHHRRRGARGALPGAPAALRRPARLGGSGVLARWRWAGARVRVPRAGDAVASRRASRDCALRPRRGRARRARSQPGDAL